MKYSLLILTSFLILILHKANAQYENVWVFGQGAGVDFNGGPPSAIPTNYHGFGEAAASVCNEKGQLLFYTEGSYVWDARGDTMANGANLTPIPSLIDFSPTSSTSQGCIIVPFPGNTHQYYIFSLTSIEQNRNAGRLYYSVVDMRLNNGQGAIVAGQKAILLDSGLTEKMTGIAGNHCNVFLLLHQLSSNIFRTWEITEFGIRVTPVISAAGNFRNYDNGALAIASSGKKVAAVAPLNTAVELFDFDLNTGAVSNAITLDDHLSCLGVAFSSDNSKLYVGGYDNAGSNSGDGGAYYQFDLNQGGRKTLVGRSYWGAYLKRGPDDKIYFRSAVSYLGVIHSPNLAGTACNFILNGVALPNVTDVALGLPNVVPVIRRDTTSTIQVITAGCFANVNSLLLKAIKDTSGWDFFWNNGTINASIAVDTPGTYWVSYHAPPCQVNVDTFVVQFPNGILPQIRLRAACARDNNGRAYAFTYAGDTVTYHYTWSNDADSILSTSAALNNVRSGNYRLRVTTATCDTTLSLFIPEENAKASFKADSIICAAQELLFDNTSDPHFSRFSWNFGDGIAGNQASPAHTYNLAGTYQVVLTAYGDICKDTVYQGIVVDSLVSPHFSALPDRICSGQSILFLAPLPGTTIHNMNWQLGDGSILSTDFVSSIQHAYAVSGARLVTLTVQFRTCPEGVFTDTVYVDALPVVNLGPDSGICLEGSPILLENQWTQGLSCRYTWNTGDTTAALTVNYPGIYSLNIRTEPLGCSNTGSIDVKKDCYLDIPNAFTPNDDGFNDYFFPRKLLSKSVSRFKMQIVNRWGQVVFESTNPDGRGWNGQYNGKEQPATVYVFLIEALLNNGQQEHYKGNVTLMR